MKTWNYIYQDKSRYGKMLKGKFVTIIAQWLKINLNNHIRKINFCMQFLFLNRWHSAVWRLKKFCEINKSEIILLLHYLSPTIQALVPFPLYHVKNSIIKEQVYLIAYYAVNLISVLVKSLNIFSKVKEIFSETKSISNLLLAVKRWYHKGLVF